MILRYALAIAAVLALIAASSSHRPVPTQTSDAKLKFPIVRLHRAQDGAFFCSGSVISDQLILTAAHCVAGAPLNKPLLEIRDMFNKGKTPASVLEYNERADFALLKGDFKDFKHMTYTVKPQEIVDSFHLHRLTLCGYPHAGQLFCSQFKFIGQTVFGMAGYAHMWPGMSGGPIIDMETGQIVAVVTGMDGDKGIVSPIIELFESLHVKGP